MFVSSTLLALVLATPDAEAGRIGKKPIDIPKGVSISVDGFVRAVVVTGEATAISADISSDSGSETVDLTEADAWVHATAHLKELSTTDTAATLTVYDEKGTAQMSFSGTLGKDGSVSLTADSSGSCNVKGGCDVSTGSSTLDIELLAAEVFANPDGGYDVTFDLSGADVYGRTIADFTLKNFGAAQADAGRVVTSDVTFGDIGAVWEGELTLAHEGEITIDSTSYDIDGKKLEKSSVSLGAPWDDGGEGVNALTTDGYPLTSVAILSRGGSVAKEECWDVFTCFDSGLTIVSHGWYSFDATPQEAKIEVDNGETLTIPANSYQVAAATEITFSGSPEKEAFQLTIDGTTVKEGSSFGDRGLCANGTCVALAQATDANWTLSATAYSATAAKLPKSVKVTLTSTLKAASTKESSYTLTFDPEIAVVFANEVSLSGDPLGVDLAGEVSLLGAADSKGKQKTLAKGDFYGSFTRDGDGDLSLGGMDKNDVDAKGDILIGGEPIDFELTDTNKDGVIEAPPVIVYKAAGNGKGTRAVATVNTGKPGLL